MVRRQSDDGFTLMELLVVAVIIGILAGIATLSLTGANRGAIVRACAADARSVAAAMGAYKSDYESDALLRSNGSLYLTTGELATKGYFAALDTSGQTDYTLTLGWVSASPFAWQLSIQGGAATKTWNPAVSSRGDLQGLCGEAIRQ